MKQISQNEYVFRCPNPEGHKNGDQHPSCRYNPQKDVAYCDVCGYKARGERFVETVTDAVEIRLQAKASKQVVKEVETYKYTDMHGKTLYEVIRYEPKTFKQRRIDESGKVVWSLEGVQRVLYKLPDVLLANQVLFTEGEKDVHTAERLGYIATTLAGGVNAKWDPGFNKHLLGREVVIVPDLDRPGLAYAEKLSMSMRDLTPIVVHLPEELNGKQIKDLTDYVDAGGTQDALDELISDARARSTGDLGGESIETVSEAAIAEMEELRSGAGYDMQFGIGSLDAHLGGIRRKRVYVVGAKTSHGKTAFACNVMHRAIKDGKRVLYFGSETINELPYRLASLECSLPSDWFIKPHTITQEQYDQAKKAVQDICKGANLWVLQPCKLERVRKAVEIYNPDLVIVDYVQLWVSSTSDPSSRHEYGKVVSLARDCASKYNTSWFVMSQIRRFGDRHGKDQMSPEQAMPTLQDLKESGNLEEFATDVLLLHWVHLDCPEVSKNTYKIHLAKTKMASVGLHTCHIEPTTNKITSEVTQ